MSFVLSECHCDRPKRRAALAGLPWLLAGGCEALVAEPVCRDPTRACPCPLPAMPMGAQLTRQSITPHSSSSYVGFCTCTGFNSSFI